MLDVFGLFSVPTLYVLIGIIVLLIVAIILSIVAIAKSSQAKGVVEWQKINNAVVAAR